MEYESHTYILVLVLNKIKKISGIWISHIYISTSFK